MSIKLFTISEEWMRRYATKGIGWNKNQLEAIGVDYKKKRKGWLKELVGEVITFDQKEVFEQLSKATPGEKKIHKKNKNKPRRRSSYEAICLLLGDLSADELECLAEAISYQLTYKR
jgi:hypothetical protein